MNAARIGLRELTRGFAGEDWPDLAVDSLALDSREVAGGALFLALPGRRSDGRRYIDASLRAGAVAVLAERDEPSRADGRRVFELPDLKARVGTIADRFFGHPSQQLCVVGVTGTNGKTTCSHLLAEAVCALGGDGAVMGTLGVGRPGALAPSPLTTADVVAVHRNLRHLLDDGARFVAMEVSSHALDQGRVDKVAFDFALFTNLSQDHLDYHADMESYGAAKARLFEVADLAACVINIDDAFGRVLAERVEPARLWSYGHGADARVRARSVTLGDHGLALVVDHDGHRTHLAVPLLGRFNVDNVLAVFATLLAMGFDGVRAAAALAAVHPVPGRMEQFDAPGHARVVVDYAHTPDALEKALAACREQTAGALWVVFGCGGDRDRGKRAAMGAVAARLADHVVLTNDNPRGEPPLSIIEQIREGGDGRERVLADRRAAIEHAVSRAVPGDLVLVAGKGHETGQHEGDVVRPFSDREVVLALLGRSA